MSNPGARSPSPVILRVELAGAFGLSILPPSFVKIRHFGFLANGCRAEALKLCRTLLCVSATAEPVAPPTALCHRAPLSLLRHWNALLPRIRSRPPAPLLAAGERHARLLMRHRTLGMHRWRLRFRSRRVARRVFMATENCFYRPFSVPASRSKPTALRRLSLQEGHLVLPCCVRSSFKRLSVATKPTD
jgi:hypothetical protein